ncbi:hypothetical protein [Bradyrhizobium cenepequi]
MSNQSTEIISGSCGCSRETMDRIAAVLGMTEAQLVRANLDMDVLDAARLLDRGQNTGSGRDLRVAVRRVSSALFRGHRDRRQ